MERSLPGNELAELLWENSPGIRWTAAPDPFPPFSCSADGTTSATAMAQGDHDNAVPWLHYPIIGVDDGDTECCSALLFRYSNHPTAMASRHARAPSMSHAAVVVPPLPEPPTVPKQQQQQPRPTGEGAMNFPFFSRPLQRPLPQAGERASAGGSNPVDVQTNLLRSTPLFSKQRMAWLQPPKESPARPPPASPVPVRHAAEPAAALPPRLQPEVRAPAMKTTSSVCFDKGDQSQLKRSSHQVWSVSQEDEDLDDEAGGLRRSAARSTKRGRNAQVHNMSERRRRGRINDKIRALQELIPNCNKIDKASILEEAIEYVKTLQLQVQMMSTMGTAGLCVCPMVAMQHMQMPPMAHLHHHLLGVMGFGMGAFDPRLAGAVQFPYPMIPGVPMFHQAAAASAQMAAGTVTNNAAAAQTEQTPSQHPQVNSPQVPRPM